MREAICKPCTCQGAGICEGRTAANGTKTPNGRRAKASRRPFSEEDARRPEKHRARRPTPSASGAGPTETTTTGPLVAEGWPPPKTKQRTEMMLARVCRSDTPHSAGGNVRRGRWVPKRRKGLRSQDLRKRNENAATRHSCSVPGSQEAEATARLRSRPRDTRAGERDADGERDHAPTWPHTHEPAKRRAE